MKHEKHGGHLMQEDLGEGVYKPRCVHQVLYSDL